MKTVKFNTRCASMTGARRMIPIRSVRFMTDLPETTVWRSAGPRVLPSRRARTSGSRAGRRVPGLTGQCLHSTPWAEPKQIHVSILSSQQAEVNRAAASERGSW